MCGHKSSCAADRESAAQRPLCFRPMSSAGRPMCWPSSSFGDRNRRQDTGLLNLCPPVSESRDFLETEATAGIATAVEVLQTSALPLGYVADDAGSAVRRRLVPKSNDSHPLTLF